MTARSDVAAAPRAPDPTEADVANVVRLVEAGKVMIEWRRRAKGDRIVFSWTEKGGPPTILPTREGVGSTVIARAAPTCRLRSR
jgi:hypothetical protein